MRVPFSFLTEQFANSEPIFAKMRDFLKRCDFTLGEDLAEFERRYASYTGAKHAIGVGSGTDALALSLRAAGIKPP
jgi:aminotransferase EvaB